MLLFIPDASGMRGGLGVSLFFYCRRMDGGNRTGYIYVMIWAYIIHKCMFMNAACRVEGNSPGQAAVAMEFVSTLILSPGGEGIKGEGGLSKINIQLHRPFRIAVDPLVIEPYRTEQQADVLCEEIIQS